MLQGVDKSKRAVIAVFGLCAVLVVVCLLALGGLLTCECASNALPRPFSSSGTSGLMLAMGPLITLWAITVKMRCTSRFVRNCMLAVAMSFVCWLLLVLLKYASSDENQMLIEFCWYYFYLPMIMAPAMATICALYESAVSHRLFTLLSSVILAVSAILVLMVFTNGLHQAVFIFDYADEDWASNYTYGFGYKVIVVWIALLVLGFFVTILRVSRARLRGSLALVFVTTALIAAYAVLYVLRVEAIFKSNFALTYILFFVLLLELCLDFGIFPSFAHHRNAFRRLPYDVKVLDSSLDVIYETDSAAPLPESARRFMGELPEERARRRVFTVAERPDDAFIAWRIKGGSVIFRENRAEVNASTRAIMMERRALERGNKLLASELELRKKDALLESQMELAEEVRKSLEGTFATIESILEELSNPLTGADERENRKSLLKLRFLVAYSKRKGSLLLAERSDEDFDREKATLVINELASDARGAGIECASFVNEPIVVTNSTLTALYDCLYNVVLMACDQLNPVLLISTGRCDDAHAEVKIAFECDGDFDSGSVPDASAGLATLAAKLCEPFDQTRTRCELSCHSRGFALSIRMESREAEEVAE